MMQKRLPEARVPKKFPSGRATRGGSLGSGLATLSFGAGLLAGGSLPSPRLSPEVANSNPRPPSNAARSQRDRAQVELAARMGIPSETVSNRRPHAPRE